MVYDRKPTASMLRWQLLRVDLDKQLHSRVQQLINELERGSTGTQPLLTAASQQPPCYRTPPRQLSCSGWQKLPGPTVTSKFDITGDDRGVTALMPGPAATLWLGVGRRGIGAGAWPHGAAWWPQPDGSAAAAAALKWQAAWWHSAGAENCTKLSKQPHCLCDSLATHQKHTVWRILFGFRSHAPNLEP